MPAVHSHPVNPVPRRFLAFVAIFALFATAHADQYRWSGVERVVALSDPHGAYDALCKTLRNAGVIDDANQWVGGATHLVITGDLLDRGAESRKVMDLVMSLETQAPQSGGMVHLTLGNHEVMNLVGDLRYVAKGEYAAFADEESREEREQWFATYKAARGGGDEASLRVAFEQNRPPGFYAHRRAFRSDGYYGKWLLTRPVMVVINDTAFVHGGLSPLVAGYTLDSLNLEMHAQVADYVSGMEQFAEAGLLDPAENFYSHAEVLQALAAASLIPDELKGAAEKMSALNDASIHDSQSPLWYRGTVGCSTLLEDDTLRAALDAVGASRVVIGHTPTLTRRVLQRHGGRVIEIDTGMLSAAYRGSGFALVMEGDDLAVLSESSSTPTAPVNHPRRVGIRPGDMTADELAQFLRTGEIVGWHENPAGQEVVQVASGDVTLNAIFIRNPRNRNQSPALATYRLDRMLELDMVPVTVAREVDGKKGALQFLADSLANETQRAEGGRGSGAWCHLSKQWNAMYIYDSLIHNEGRPPTSMLYSPDNWQMILSGNGNTFATKRGTPRYLEQAPLDIGGAWTRALESLSEERLREHLGDVLDKRRISALSSRRDLLLEEAH